MPHPPTFLDQFVPLLAAHVIVAQLLPLVFGGISRNPAAMKRCGLANDLPWFQFGFAVFRRALRNTREKLLGPFDELAPILTPSSADASFQTTIELRRDSCSLSGFRLLSAG